MKIGLVCPYDIFSPGGVREHVLALYKEFKKRGFPVKIIAPKTRKTNLSDFILLGKSIKFPSGTGSWGRISACFDNKEIEKVLRKENFDILHFHAPLVPFLSWQILFSSKAKNIITFHSFWDEKKSLLSNFEFLVRSFAELFTEKFDGLIAVSSAAKNCWQKFYPKKITVIPNGIDLSRFHPQVSAIEKYKKGRFLNILFVGRLETRKGAIYLLRAFEKMKNKHLRLFLVGSGPGRLELELFVRMHNLANVEFVGRANDSELPKYYALADICCFPSTGGESFGIVLLEAMASGKPIVCFANSGYKEVLRDYPFRGGLVKIGDSQALARALAILVENRGLRQKLSEWGVEEVKKYSWQKIAERVLKHYGNRK